MPTVVVAPIAVRVIVPVPPSIVKLSLPPSPFPSIEVLKVMSPSCDWSSSVSIMTSPSIITASLNVTVALVPSSAV